MKKRLLYLIILVVAGLMCVLAILLVRRHMFLYGLKPPSFMAEVRSAVITKTNDESFAPLRIENQRILSQLASYLGKSKPLELAPGRIGMPICLIDLTQRDGTTIRLVFGRGTWETHTKYGWIKPGGEAFIRAQMDLAIESGRTANN